MEQVTMQKNSKKYGFNKGDIFVVKRTVMGEYYLRIKNPNAVCSNDIWYYTVQVKDIIKPNVRDYLGMLKQGYAYEICKQEKHDDGCHVNYYYKRDEELNELVHQIDFNNVVIER